MTFTARLRGSGLLLVMLLLAAEELRGELRVTSTVQVKTEPRRDAGLLTSAAMSALPFYLTKGKAEVVTIVARGQVRVEGLGPVLGLDPDVVLLSKANGETVYLLPGSRAFFKTQLLVTAVWADSFGSTLDVIRRSKSDVILGQRAERISEVLKLRPGTRDGNPDYARDRFGRTVPAWTLDETPEQRTARFVKRETDPRELWKEMPISIESWVSDGFGPAATVAAQSGAGITALATAGFAVLPDRRFALRQVIRNPVGGYSVESRVIAVSALVVGDELFEIPPGYREVKAPSTSGPSSR